MNEITAVKDGKVYCTYLEDDPPDKKTIKGLSRGGYKLYQNGKLYKPQKDKAQED